MPRFNLFAFGDEEEKTPVARDGGGKVGQKVESALRSAEKEERGGESSKREQYIRKMVQTRERDGRPGALAKVVMVQGGSSRHDFLWACMAVACG